MYDIKVHYHHSNLTFIYGFVDIIGSRVDLGYILQFNGRSLISKADDNIVFE